MYFGDSTRNKDLEVNENNKEYDASFFQIYCSIPVFNCLVSFKKIILTTFWRIIEKKLCVIKS